METENKNEKQSSADYRIEIHPGEAVFLNGEVPSSTHEEAIAAVLRDQQELLRRLKEDEEESYSPKPRGR